MTADEAATLITAIADSLEREPAQFHVEVSAIGTQITMSPGASGIGMQISAVGGGPGSNTVGFQSTVSSPTDIQVAQTVEQASHETVAILRELAEAATATDKGKIASLIERLPNATVAAAMLVETVSTALKLADRVS